MTSQVSIVSASGSESNRVVRRVALILVLGLVLVGLVHTANAQATTRISILPGLNGPVNAISEPDANGTRYLGGDFTALDVWDTGGGALTNATSGTVDPTFPKVTGGASAVVLASAADGNGGFYIVGFFTHVDGIARNNAAHINADGSVDPTWNPNANDIVRTIAVSGSTVYLGGSFTRINGSTTRNYAAAVDTTTGTATSWNPNASASGPFGGGDVLAIVVSGSTVYLGGKFTTINDPALPRNYLAAIGTDGAVSAQWSTCAPTVTPSEVPSEVPSAAPSAVSLVAASALPAKPTGIRWSRDTRRITGRFTPTVGVTYAIAATSTATRRFQTRATRTARGTCKVTTSKKSKKRTAACTIRLKQAGTWLVNITPTQNGIAGTPATKTIKISTPRPAGASGPAQPVTG